MLDLRTPKEKEREARNKEIRNDYRRIKADMPDASDYRLYSAIARKYKLSWVSVRKIVLNA